MKKTVIMMGYKFPYGDNTMKRKILISFPILVAASILGIFIISAAGVQAAVGECSNCHVMHASEVSLELGIYAPSDTLLRNNCIGCHTGASSAVVPSVFNSLNDLAGGDFEYSENDERKGHNPVEIGADTLLTEPPGWKNGFSDSAGGQIASSNGGSWATKSLTCAGNFGCHGDHTEPNATRAMAGSHHVNKTGEVDGSSLGESFRFLVGIKGIEDSDWQELATATERNVYYGSDNRDVTMDVTINQDKQTISYLCAQCHGIFHAGAGAEGISDDINFGTDPWIRHPVDIDMPVDADDWDYGNGAYLVDVPVATSDLLTASSPANHNLNITNAGHRVVMCLSCHVAHASNYQGMLRWEKSDPKAGQGASNVGCLACHTSVDGVNGY